MNEELIPRVWRRVNVRGRCWIWTGSRNRRGYGRLTGRGHKTLPVHRLVYSWTFGEIPEGFVVMHACDNPSCVNPSHLSVGTPRDNNLDMHRKGRAVIPTGWNANMTRCRQGHEFTPENTIPLRNGWRRCRVCTAAYLESRRDIERAREKARTERDRIARQIARGLRGERAS